MCGSKWRMKLAIRPKAQRVWAGKLHCMEDHITLLTNYIWNITLQTLSQMWWAFLLFPEWKTKRLQWILDWEWGSSKGVLFQLEMYTQCLHPTLLRQHSIIITVTQDSDFGPLVTWCLNITQRCKPYSSVKNISVTHQDVDSLCTSSPEKKRSL